MCVCGGPCVLPSQVPASVAFVGRTGSDLDRVEIQISALKNALRELLPNANIKDFVAPQQAPGGAPETAAAPSVNEAPRKRPNIFVSKPADGTGMK